MTKSENWEDSFDEAIEINTMTGKHKGSNEYGPCPSYGEGYGCCLNDSWIKTFISDLLAKQRLEDKERVLSELDRIANNGMNWETKLHFQFLKEAINKIYDKKK